MASSGLLGHVLLRFEGDPTDIVSDLSAVVLTPEPYLWVGSDETTAIERLSPIRATIPGESVPQVWGNHHSFAIADLLDWPTETEIDFEGFDYDDHYLWVVGSHSPKRKKPKGKNPDKDIEQLATVVTEPSRYLLARLPLVGGNLQQWSAHPDGGKPDLVAACLPGWAQAGSLLAVLAADSHLKPFLNPAIASKENGLDIEGIAVRGDRVFLGLRGPVLRGWAIVLDFWVEDTTPGKLGLVPQAGLRYRKHFLELNGLGIRDLCFHGDDLLILAGPTMDLAGMMQLFRLKDALGLTGDTIHSQGEGRLEWVFDFPLRSQGDKAEGMTLFPTFAPAALDSGHGLLVVYDSPLPERLPHEKAIFADVFALA
ncbi:DUF3616 domain-containing protein [Trichothermofontia sp.]